jgi:ribosomal protein L37AE/L43A
MPLVLPKRCPNCGRKCTKTATGYWLCDPATGGCGWTDDPGTLQPAETTQATEVVSAPEPSAS